MDNLLTIEEIEELEKLEREATQGPWELNDPWGHSNGANSVQISSWPSDFCQATHEADNRIIAAARNALPKLLAMAREAAKLLAELAEADEKITRLDQGNDVLRNDCIELRQQLEAAKAYNCSHAPNKPNERRVYNNQG